MADNPYAADIAERPSSPASGANPYADDIRDKGQATPGGLGHNAVAGINEGIAKTLGYPADVVGGLINQAAYGVNKLAGRKVVSDSVQPFGGSESIKRGLTRLGVEDPDKIEATNAPERIVRAGGEGAGSMVAGAGMVGGAKALIGSAAPRLFSALESVLGRPTPATAATGAATGAGSQAGAEIAPEGYKTPFSVAGGLVGGSLPLAARVAYEGGRFVVNAVGHALQPFTKSGQEALAGQHIFQSASDPYAAAHTIETAPAELVKGSRPTTFQVTGDMGLGQLERSVRTNNPDDFLQRAAEQNAARRGAIQGVQAAGNPADVSAHFRGLRQSLDNVTEAAVTQATQRRNQATAAMGGTGSAEGYGATMRAPAQEARDTAKEAERSLWNAVDPHGNLVMPGTPIANVARNIEGQMSRSAKPISGEERDIFDVARSYGDRTPFQDVRDLRGRISAAMSEELRNNGRTPVYARLTQLRTAVENTIDRAVENQAQVEQNAVRRGQMSEEDTMAARVLQQTEEWRARRNSEQANASGGAGTAGAAGPTAVPGNVRTNGQAGGPAGLAPGDQGLQGVPLDDAAAERLRAASAATRQRKTTFDEGATGAVLRPGSRAGEYRTPDSLVPAKVFHPGANGGEDVRHYINAVGEDRAIPAIADYAAFSLRRAAMRPDGSIDTAKALAWARQHDAALAELPASVRSRLANPGRAEEAVTQAAANRKEQLQTFDRSAIAGVMGTEQGDVVRQVGSVFDRQDAAARMGDLARAASTNPAAKNGLRRAIVEHIQSKFMTNAEAATTEQSMIKADAFQTFMRTKADVLAKVFTPKEIENLKNVAQDIQRANRSINATKLPGGSNTAQDTASRMGQHGSLLNELATEAAIATAGHAIGGTTGGVAGWIGKRVFSSLRDAGISRVDDLVKEAMLNPDLARELIRKVPANAPSREAASQRLSQTLKRISVAVATNAIR